MGAIVARVKDFVDRYIRKEVTRLIQTVHAEISKSVVLPGTLDELFKKISVETVRDTKVDYLNWKNSTYLGERKNERVWLSSQTKNNFWRLLFSSLKSLSRWDYKRLGIYPGFAYLYAYLKNSSDLKLINFLKHTVMGCNHRDKSPLITKKSFIRYFCLLDDFFEEYCI